MLVLGNPRGRGVDAEHAEAVGDGRVGKWLVGALAVEDLRLVVGPAELYAARAVESHVRKHGHRVVGAHAKLARGVPANLRAVRKKPHEVGDHFGLPVLASGDRK